MLDSGSGEAPQRIESPQVKMISLETERLKLRHFQTSDFESYASMSADEEVMRFINAGKPLSRLDAWRHMAMIIGHWQIRGFGMWAVADKKSDTFLGRVGFIQPEGWPGFELGWALDRQFWNQGFATEAANKALHYGIEELGKDHIISLIDPDNIASINVAKKIGEQYEKRIDFLGHKILVFGIHAS